MGLIRRRLVVTQISGHILWVRIVLCAIRREGNTYF